ncbi:MAG TPA: hypothetical protein VK186_07675 [Candidatus Deferrimicrobium sp.]|nr:hypothetical protein [Candidatus Deferrimicrobium sp.]
MKTMSPKIRFVLSILAVILFTVLVIQVLKIVNADKESEKRALNDITGKGESIVNELDKQYEKLKKISRSLADEIMAGRIKKEDLPAVIKNAMENNPEVYACGAAFEPGYFGKDVRLYAPVYVHGENGLEYRPLEKLYDYTGESMEAQWYRQAKKSKEVWHEPFFGKACRALVETYTVPLFSPSGKDGKKFFGIVMISYSLDYIKKVMDTFGLEQTGYGYIISKKGRFLVHPSSEIVNQEKTLSQLAKETGRDDLKQLWKKVKAFKKEAEVFNGNSILTAQPAILYLKTIPAMGWSFIADFVRSEIEIDYTSQNRCKMRAIITGCLLSAILCALLFRVYNGKTRAIWLLAITFSIISCVGIIALWACENSGDVTNGGIKMTDRTTLKKFLKDHGEKELIRIPTGIFIQSLEFRSANDVLVTGNIWQKYSKDLPPGISRGFNFCEAINPRIDKIYEIDYPNQTTIGWHFETVLRQYFDYERYPMDKKDVWIRMEHTDIHKPTILVPDFDSYKMIYPGFLPGIEPRIIIPGLTLNRSFFSYVLQSYNAHFGLQNPDWGGAFPELYFTVIVSRKFLEPFINFLLPVVVVACIIFSLLLIASYREEKTRKSAYNSSFILATAAGLFFSVLIAHSQLRNTIKVDYLIYLDYFYLILYPLILLLLLNAFMINSDKRNVFFQFRDNLLPKLLFWPVIMLFLFVLTVITVYK